jgi:hypothetical protein
MNVAVVLAVNGEWLYELDMDLSMEAVTVEHGLFELEINVVNVTVLENIVPVRCGESDGTVVTDFVARTEGDALLVFCKEADTLGDDEADTVWRAFVFVDTGVEECVRVILGVPVKRVEYVVLVVPMAVRDGNVDFVLVRLLVVDAVVVEVALFVFDPMVLDAVVVPEFVFVRIKLSVSTGDCCGDFESRLLRVCITEPDVDRVSGAERV